VRGDLLRPTPPLPPGARRLLEALGSTLLGHAADLLLRVSGDEVDLSPLEGRRVCLEVSDFPLRLSWQVRGMRLASGPASADSGADWIRIRGPLASFVRLALRVEDADTLFFQRKLSLEGDTEGALYLRNVLDAIELPAPAVLAPVLERLRELLRTP